MEITVISPTDPPRTTTHNLDARLLLRRAKAFSQHIPSSSPIPSNVPAVSTEAAPLTPNAKHESGHAVETQQPPTALPPPIQITIPNTDAQIFHHYVRLLHTAQIPILPALAHPRSDRSTTSPSSRRYRCGHQPTPDTTATTWYATFDQIQTTHLLLAKLYLLTTYTMHDAHGSNQVLIAVVQALNGLLLDSDSVRPPDDVIDENSVPQQVLNRRLGVPRLARPQAVAPVKHVLPAHDVIDAVHSDPRVAGDDALRRVYVAAFVRWGATEVMQEARAEAEKLGEQGMQRWWVFVEDVKRAFGEEKDVKEEGEIVEEKEKEEDRLLDWREFVVGWTDG